MEQHITIPRWSKWAGGIALLAIALTAGSLGLALNVSHGLEAGLAAGIAFGLADLAKISIPLVAGLIGWSKQLKLTAAVCVAVSLWSAVNVYCDGAGQALLTRQHAAETYGDKAQAITELKAEATRLEGLADDAQKHGGCGPLCRGFNGQADKARQQLATARQAKANAKPVEVSGLASLIAVASGTRADEIARGIGAIKAGLFLVLIEALVWLSVPAMALLKMPTTAKAVAKPIEPAAKPLQSLAKSAPAGTRAYYLQRLEREHPAIAKQVHGGELSVHAASIQAGLRKAPDKSKWTKIDAYLEPTKADA